MLRLRRGGTREMAKDIGEGKPSRPNGDEKLHCLKEPMACLRQSRVKMFSSSISPEMECIYTIEIILIFLNKINRVYTIIKYG